MGRSRAGVPLLAIVCTAVATVLMDSLIRSYGFSWQSLVREYGKGGEESGTFVGQDSSSAPVWQLPENVRKEVVMAVPLSKNGTSWVRVSRAWRRGIRAAFVTDFTPDAELLLDGGAHGETFVYVNATELPYHYYGKAAMVPSMVHEHVGEFNYRWMLYGDDDTLWHMDSVASIISRLDPDLPWMITDHTWFWGEEQGGEPYPVHPSPAAPRCLPCHFNKTRLAGHSLPFDPPLACPYCTFQLLCEADKERKHIYAPDCNFNPIYPPKGEFIAHGGAGIILSVGLMRMMPVSYMQDCVENQFRGLNVPGGDTLFSHCVFFTGIAPTDPGYYFLDKEFNAFDQGGQLVLQSLDLMYHYLKRGCCPRKCQQRLRAAASVHLRGLHFKEPEAAMDVARMIVRMRDLYLHVRDMGGNATAHEEVPASWDNHKVCY